MPLRRSSLVPLLPFTPDTDDIDWASLSLELSAETREKLMESGCRDTGRLLSKRVFPQPVQNINYEWLEILKVQRHHANESVRCVA